MTFSVWATTSTTDTVAYSVDPVTNSTNRGESSVTVGGVYSGAITVFTNPSTIYAGQAFGVKCNYMNPNHFDAPLLMNLYCYQV